MRDNEYRYHGNLGARLRCLRTAARRAGIRDVIHRVPPDVPISTSRLLNPALSARDIALVYPYLGQQNEPAQAPQYVILDKLLPMIEPTDRYLEELHRDSKWQVAYENEYAALFKRRNAR